MVNCDGFSLKGLAQPGINNPLQKTRLETISSSRGFLSPSTSRFLPSFVLLEENTIGRGGGHRIRNGTGRDGTDPRSVKNYFQAAIAFGMTVASSVRRLPYDRASDPSIVSSPTEQRGEGTGKFGFSLCPSLTSHYRALLTYVLQCRGNYFGEPCRDEMRRARICGVELRKIMREGRNEGRNESPCTLTLPRLI